MVSSPEIQGSYPSLSKTLPAARSLSCPVSPTEEPPRCSRARPRGLRGGSLWLHCVRAADSRSLLARWVLWRRAHFHLSGWESPATNSLPCHPHFWTGEVWPEPTLAAAVWAGGRALSLEPRRVCLSYLKANCFCQFSLLIVFNYVASFSVQ